jgi:hypothetical protein
MAPYIVKMIWVYLFMSLIAANAGAATIITKTHITTTKIAVSAQLDTRSLRLASSDPKITKPDATSIDEFTPGIGADKRQVLNNTTASSIHLLNGTSTNGSVAGLGPGVMGLTASITALNYTMLSKGNTTASTQQSNTMSEKNDSSSGSENLNSMTARNSSQSILSTTRMANTTLLGTGATTPFSGTSNSSVAILSSSRRTISRSSSASDTSVRSSRDIATTDSPAKSFSASPPSSSGSEETKPTSTTSIPDIFSSLHSKVSISKMPKPKTTDSGNQLTTTKPSNTGGEGSMITSQSSGTGGNLFDQPHLQEVVTLMTVFWRHSAQSLECKPPCKLTLPPIPLDKPATLFYPYVTKSVCTKLGGVVYRYVSTISVTPVTIEALELKPLSVEPMLGGLLSSTAAAEPLYPLGSCSMALPGGDDCKGSPYPPSDNNGRCGPTDKGARGCPDMQCCGPEGIW